MKIAFIVGQFPLLSEAFILNQITGVLERGHEVDIYSLEGPSGEDKVHPDVEKYELLNRTYYAPKLEKNYLWRGLKGFWLLAVNSYKDPLACMGALNFFKYGNAALSLRLLYAAIPFLGSQSYDIIHAQFGIYALQGMLIRDIGALKGKLITSFRGFDISWFIKKYGDRVYDRLFQNGDFFLTNCDYFKSRILKIGCDPNKVIVHRSGIDCDKFAFTTRCLPVNGKIRIVTVGRLVEKKGIEYGIRAVAKVAKINSQIEYNIIGDGKLREKLQKLIEDMGMSDRIKLLGWKTQQELREILDKSHILVAPSLTASDGNQDAPVNTLKEAMAMGLPAIGTQHGGIPELIEDGVSGFLVPEGNADAIAEKLTYLLEHPEIWPEMGKAGRLMVEQQYDKNKLNNELIEIYREVSNTGNFDPALMHANL